MDRKDKKEEDPMEKELAEDAVWKRIQRNTFTRWVNNHVNSVNKHIEDLEQDLCDGLRLIALIEVLSGKRIERYNKRPTVRAQKLENVGIVLRFLSAEEKIKLVNIDSIDLVDSNIKLILGLIWTLILHYSISTPLWEGEEEELDEKGNKKKETPKHRLLRWINNKLPELRISNFNVDWNSAALVDAIAPGLFPDWADLKPEDSLLIAKKAIALADKWLNCPPLITAEDLVNPKVDDLSVMTYLSNFPNAKLKENAPLTQRCNPNRVRVYGSGVQPTGVVVGAPTTFTVETFSAGDGKLEVKVFDEKDKEVPVKCVFNEDRSKTYTCTYTAKSEGKYKVKVIYANKEVPKSPFNVLVQGNAGDASKVTINGPGLNGGQVNKQTYFDVDTSAGGLGQIEVDVIDLQDNKPCNLPLRIVPIEEQKAMQEEEKTETKKEEQKISRRQQEQQPELVKPSQQRKASQVELVKPSEDTPTKFRVEYVPQKPGAHQIQVRFAGKNVNGSPCKVNFIPQCDITKIKASGKGLYSVRVGENADFRIFTEDAGQGKLQVYVQDPNGKKIPIEMRQIDLDSKAKKQQKSTIEVTKDNVCSDIATGGVYDVVYKPEIIGKHNVVIQYGEQEILRSPFEVNVTKSVDSKVVAYGPGLVGGIAHSPALIYVDTRGEDKSLGFLVEGPSQAKIECKDNGDGSCVTSYLPTAPGEYVIHILSDNEDIPNSPYVAQILPRTDYSPELVKISGKGVQPSGVARNVPVKFEVDCRDAGSAPTEVLVMNASNLKNVPVKCEKRRRSSVDLAGQKKVLESQTKKSKTMSTIKDSVEKKEGDVFDCVYTAQDLGKHVVQVNFGGVSCPGSPFNVQVGEIGQPNKVKVFGPGVENGILPGTKTHFNIDAREAGVGEIQVQVDELRNGKKIPVNLINNGNDTYTVEYNVDDSSSYRVDVSLDGKSCAGTPVTVRTAEPINKSQIKILKLNNTAYLNNVNTFVVDTRALKDKENPVQIKCEIKTKSGKQQLAKVEKLEDGTHLVTFRPTEKGETFLNVLCDNQAVADQPFKVQVEDGFDEKKISVYGKNLNNGKVGQYNEFTIDTRNAGFANLALGIEGPEDCEFTCTDNEDGTFLCKYKPDAAGKYEIDVKFGNKSVPGSPFVSNVQEDIKIDIDKVKLSNVDPKVLASIPTHFDINSKDIGSKTKPDVEIKGPDGEKCKVKIEEKENGIYRVEYTPEEIGKYQVTCNFNSIPVPKTPITVDAVPTGNPSKCVLREKLEKQIKAGKEQKLTIDCKDAGKGAVTAKISNLSKKDTKTTSKDKNVKKITEEDETIKVRVKDNQDGTFSVFYKVDQPGEYVMDLKFGGQTLPSVGKHSFVVVEEEVVKETETTTTKKKTGNKETVNQTNSTKTTTKRTVIKTEESYEEEETTITEYRLVELKNLPLPKITHKKKQNKKQDETISSTVTELIGIVKLPNGEQEKVNIIDNRNNTINVQYKPRMDGEHLLSITTTDNEHIQGSPFKFYAQNTKAKTAAAYGPGLISGVAREPAIFYVNTKDCGLGGLKISVEGPGKSAIDSQDDGDNLITVRYIPPTPGEYRISIHFADKPIHGSPFTAKITGEGKERSNICISNNTEIKLKINEDYTKDDNFVAKIISPSGVEDDCYLKRITETNQILVNFIPQEAGNHLIHVLKNNNPVFGSPFKINVLPTEVGNPNLVKLSGNGHKYGKTMVENSFIIDTRNAGYGNLQLSITGPSKVDIKSDEVEPGVLKITYFTKTPGYYLLSLKFADQDVPGVGTIEITGVSEQFQTESRNLQTRTIEEEHKIGSICKISLNITQTLSKQKLKAYITTPSGKRTEANLKQVNQINTTHIVEFTSTEIGKYIIEIIEEQTNKNIPGFPMSYQVGKSDQTNDNLVTAIGPGLEGGIVNQKGLFDIHYPNAKGKILIEMEGPGKAILDVSERKDEFSYAVSYLVDKPGEYRLSIKFSDKHINGSPFRVWVMPEQDLAKKIVLEQLSPKQNVIQNKTITMKVHLNGVSLKRKTTTVKTTETLKETTTTTTTKQTSKTDDDNELIAKLISPSGKEEDIFLTEIDENTCILSFKPREPGPSVVNVRLNNVHVTNSPSHFFVKKSTTKTTTQEKKTTTINKNEENIKNVSTNKETVNQTKTTNIQDTKTTNIQDTKTTNIKDTKTTTNVQDTSSNTASKTDSSKQTTTTTTEEKTTITCTKTQVKVIGMKRDVNSNLENEFIVDTQNAPMGKLNVKIDGPYKTQINLSLCDEGYKVKYILTGPGKYFMQAKYNDQDITGFPYEIIVDNQTNTKRDVTDEVKN